MTFLSICIPTYNRAEYLPATLDSIAREWADDLEITVADNASTDGSDALIESYRQKLGRVRYFRWETNQGADRNYLKAVELASGKYTWLLGSDDPLRPGAIETLRNTLQQNAPTIALFNRFLCTKDLQPMREDRFLNVGGAKGKTFDFRQRGALKQYFESARSICSTFSYVSSTAFLKEAWDSVPTDETFIGTAYVHVQKLLDVCRRGALLHYLNAPLVNCRLGNDAFRDLGLAKRVLLDLHGYDMLADTCFADDPETGRALRSVVLHEYPFGRILRYQCVLGQDGKWPEILRLLRDKYLYNPNAMKLATTLGRSRQIVNLSFAMRDAWNRWNPREILRRNGR